MEAKQKTEGNDQPVKGDGQRQVDNAEQRKSNEISGREWCTGFLKWTTETSNSLLDLKTLVNINACRPVEEWNTVDFRQFVNEYWHVSNKLTVLCGSISY